MERTNAPPPPIGACPAQLFFILILTVKQRRMHRSRLGVGGSEGMASAKREPIFLTVRVGYSEGPLFRKFIDVKKHFLNYFNNLTLTQTRN